MGKIADLTGERFGRLTVVSYGGRKGKHNKPYWICSCDCGGTKEVLGESLKSGNTTSCGCAHREKLVAINYKHGHSREKIHNVWSAMRERCNNVNDLSYHNYGGRGISVCEEWNDFQKFYDDMADGYSIGLSIDRIDNDGNYCKENCRWVTRKRQMRNQRRTIRVEYNGESIPLLDLCEQKNLSFHMVKNRIFRRGWSVEKAINTPNLRPMKGNNKNG